MKTIRSHINPLSDERGIAMVVAMIVLLILTVIGVAANKTAIYDTMTSGIEKNKRAAFYAAEAGLEHAKAIITPYLYVPLNTDNTVLNPTWKQAVFAGATGMDEPDWWGTLLTKVQIGTDYKYTVKVRNNRDGGVTPTNDLDGQIVVQSESVSIHPGGGSAAVEILIGGEFSVSGVAGNKPQAGYTSSKTSTNDDKTAIADGDLSGSPRIARGTGVGLP